MKITSKAVKDAVATRNLVDATVAAANLVLANAISGNREQDGNEKMNNA